MTSIGEKVIEQSPIDDVENTKPKILKHSPGDNLSQRITAGFGHDSRRGSHAALFCSSPLIQHIRNLGARPWDIAFQHTFRKGNSYAGQLSKLGAMSDQPLVFYDSCPHELLVTVLSDTVGTVHFAFLACL
ncbi:putative ribonuclease H protein [Spatholobus suberectus]|nr:putative ribonuclease H protein [Spatholobus suberectus]